MWIQSFGHALRGLGEVLATQFNARIHAAAALAVALLGWALEVSALEWVALTLAVAGVWAAEAFNTAFEALCDAASPGFDERVRRAKDIAAGGVLVAAGAAAAVGGIVFGPPLLRLLN